MKRIKASLTMLVMLMVALMVTACAGSNQQNNEVEQQNNQQVEAPKGSMSTEPGITQYPITIEDFTKTTVTLEAEPTRIVTLVPSETEIVFAIGGGDKLVGVNAFSDYPEEAKAIEQVGDSAINVEAVVALEPDLVLASYSMNEPYIDAIRNLGYTVYVADPKTYNETVQHIETLGILLNKQESANDVTNNMNDARLKVEQAVENAQLVKVYLEFSPGFTVGGGEFIDELITIAGGTNISSAQAGWYEVNGEAVIDANPDVIIYPNFGEPESSILKAIQTRPGWDAIAAVQNNRVIEVSNEPLVRVGPRLASGLEEMAKAIHPELYN